MVKTNQLTVERLLEILKCLEPQRLVEIELHYPNHYCLKAPVYAVKWDGNGLVTIEANEGGYRGE